MSAESADCMNLRLISRINSMTASLPGIRVIAIGIFCCGVAFAQSLDRLPRHERDLSGEVVKSLGALFSKDNLIPLAIGSLATGAAVMPEQNLEDYFLNHAEKFDEVGAAGEVIGNAYVIAPIVGGLFVAGRIGGDARFQSMTFALTQGFLVNGAVTAAIKYPSKRWRPNDHDQLSFPSGHTSGTFMWATVLSRTYGMKASIPAYTIATYVGLSRLEANAHHLTDTVAGARSATWLVAPSPVVENPIGLRGSLGWSLQFVAALSHRFRFPDLDKL